MTKIEITHKLYGTQLKYGYIWWRAGRDDEFRKIFPKNEFTVEIYGKKIEGRKVDWKRRRLMLGAVLKQYFKKDEIIVLSKDKNNPKIIRIRKK